MNFKKITLIALFVATQTVMLAIPVSADGAVSAQPIQPNMAIESVKEGDVSDSDMIEPEIGESNNDDVESVDDIESVDDNKPIDDNKPVDPEGKEPTSKDVETQNVSTGAGELILMMNSDKMYQNNQLYLAGRPMTVKNGISYVAVRALVDRVGLKLTYDGKTKETIIISGGNELRFTTNSKSYKVNGVVKAMKGPAFQEKSVFMVPLTSITQALNIPYTVDAVGKRVILSLSSKPVASFTVKEKEIFAGQTKITYQTKSSSPSGLKIVDERWDGRQETFEESGSHVVTYSVQDSDGEWSEPYSLTIQVKAPNLPPVAMFATDKEEYKMGEYITITDQSTDDENQITKHDWANKELAFFRPGPVTIGLTVTDNQGQKDYFEKTITITEDSLYSESDFNQLFKPIGDSYAFDGSSVPSLPQIPFSISSEPSTLIRSNSPETVYSEGIVYRETALGDARFMVHHQNSLKKDVKMYVIATNKNSQATKIDIKDSGFAGPSPFATAAGNLSVDRYFQSMQNFYAKQSVTIAPGESQIILTDLNKTAMKPGSIISLFADVYSDLPIEYNVIMIDAVKEPITTLPTLRFLEEDIHNRGTYLDSTRLIFSGDVIGETASRLSIGDNNADPNLLGADGVTGAEKSNAGNFGVLYKITLDRVAPNTLVTFNGRGGKYAGVMLVNGDLVKVPNTGSLSNSSQSSVLHRTGDYEQKLEMWFTAAPGSNLPVNLLFIPLPVSK
ncbi:stalk domain-containing protein [Paenibacillus sp. IHBB 10380]|uniref:stalk domain-containing protein n=1 Tax=Paenibacillus sp. IHBB 10380 TaxID=1566358 RepID=UPI0005CFA4C0|nr:stalk domain-containing protein [Paenibacillus sp. IHBB 10380]AJS57915.1 DNA-directed RNA polymerase subunit beta [Paenibacillus sp. IHBB 10380]